MARKFIVIVLLIFTACKPKVDNSQENIDSVFGSNSFEFYIRSPHYKAGSTILFTVNKKEKNYVLGSSESHTGRFLSHQDVANFKAFFSKLITTSKGNCQENNPIFTLHAYNYAHTIEYSGCEDKWNELERVLKISEVLPKD